MAATACVTFCITWREVRAAQPQSAVIDKVTEISQDLNTYFIDDYDETEVADAAANAMIEATGDRWSYYISADEYASYEAQMNNAYVGIGITIEQSEEKGGFEVSAVTEGSPAAAAGIQAGDILVKVAGQSALELGQSGTVQTVRGEPGTQITLTFSRGGKEFDATLTRANIRTPVATYTMTDDQIGVITVRNFDTNCASETIAAVDALVADGAKGIVFDVRNNPGGLKTELVKVLDHLLPEGPLFRSRDYAGRESVDTSDASCVNLPMAVLVNGDSYSAAEFFAAAMQEYQAAVIVGAKTCGKGNFQNTFRLSDGSAIAISVGKYFTPKGVSLTDVGITPDIPADLNEESSEKLYAGKLDAKDDPQLQAALGVLR